MIFPWSHSGFHSSNHTGDVLCPGDRGFREAVCITGQQSRATDVRCSVDVRLPGADGGKNWKRDRSNEDAAYRRSDEVFWTGSTSVTVMAELIPVSLLSIRIHKRWDSSGFTHPVFLFWRHRTCFQPTWDETMPSSVCDKVTENTITATLLTDLTLL